MNYEFGLFNEIRALFSLKRIAWLSDPNYALFSVSLVFIWANVAYPVIILLAGLQSIPSCYREAAQIDTVYVDHASPFVPGHFLCADHYGHQCTSDL